MADAEDTWPFRRSMPWELDATSVFSIVVHSHNSVDETSGRHRIYRRLWIGSIIRESESTILVNFDAPLKILHFEVFKA